MNDPAAALSGFDLFCRLATSPLPERELLEGATRRLRLAPGEPLFLAGERRPQVFAVLSGVIKMVYETPGGEGWIKGFAEAGSCFASLTALEEGEQARTSYSAYAEPACLVEQIDYRQIQRLAERHLGWQRALSQAFKLYGQRKERREMELLTLSPEQRYLSFLHDRPALAAQLRQRDIASYVRVTPVALSRIRARLAGRSGGRSDVV